MNKRRCFGRYLLCLVLAFAVRPALADNTTAADLQTLVAAAQARPLDTHAARAVENAVEAGLPDQISPDLLGRLPVDTTPLPDSLGTLVVLKPYLTSQAVEPQHGLPFVKSADLFQPQTDGALGRFCTVHYTLPDDAALAARMAALLALARRTLVQETGCPAVGGDAPFDVWLCRSGAAGGEQWGRNLYFYDLDAPRSSIEWIREIVHEYSHMALPAIGGYKEPEYWANGYLGERLIVRWLQRSPNGPAQVQRDWGDFSGAANFDRLLITPALSLYHQIGPSSRWLARTDADGMRYLIGQALTVDDKYGPKMLGAAFRILGETPHAGPADWGAAVAQAIAESTPRRHHLARRL